MQRNIYNKKKNKKTKKDKKRRENLVWRNEHRPKAINYSHDDNNNKYEFIYSHNGACEGSRLISRVTNYSLILARNFIVNL